MMKNQSLIRMRNLTLPKIASIVFIIGALIYFVIIARNILVPLTFSMLLAYLLYPVVWRIERFGVHRVPSILVVIIITLAIFGMLGFFFAVQVSNIQIDISEIKQKLLDETGSPEQKIEEKFGVNMRTMEYYVDNIFNSIFTGEQTNFFTSTANTVFQLFILPVFTFFLLFYRTKIAYFIFRLVGRKRKKKAVRILRDISTVTTKYLGGLILVVMILAVLNSTGLIIIGIPHAIVLGVGSAILNLIPYFGTLLGALVPIIYVLVAMDDPFSTALKVVFLFVIVQFLENNIITPNIVGGNVRLNALTVIIGLLIGNLIWGIAGMLVVIPIIAILKIIMSNVETLKPFAYLLSSKGLEKHAIDYRSVFIKLKNRIKRKQKIDEEVI
jgi:predicted PurR-regulated permease PerM